MEIQRAFEMSPARTASTGFFHSSDIVRGSFFIPEKADMSNPTPPVLQSNFDRSQAGQAHNG